MINELNEREQKLRAQFLQMTGADHEAMKKKLLKLAKEGAPKPEPDTIEGYALLQYTTP